MAIVLTEEIITLINDPYSEKVLATVSPEGEPHVVFKGSLHVNKEGLLEYYELIETSETNRNLVHSLWFNRTVSVNIRRDKESIQIKAVPERVVTAGKEFEAAYIKLREDGRDIDLSGIWKLEAKEVRVQSFAKRWEEEDAAHPILRHLDRLTV